MRYKIECWSNDIIPNNYHYDDYISLKNNYDRLKSLPETRNLSVYKSIGFNNYILISLSDLKAELIDDFIKKVVPNEWNNYILENPVNWKVEDFLMGIERQHWTDYKKTH